MAVDTELVARWEYRLPKEVAQAHVGHTLHSGPAAGTGSATRRTTRVLFLFKHHAMPADQNARGAAHLRVKQGSGQVPSAPRGSGRLRCFNPLLPYEGGALLGDGTRSPVGQRRHRRLELQVGTRGRCHACAHDRQVSWQVYEPGG